MGFKVNTGALAKIILLVFMTSCFPGRAWAGTPDGSLQYYVLPGDQLGRVLQRMGLRLWGKNGAMKKAIQLNPHAIRNKGNLILAGSSIILPAQVTTHTASSSKNRQPAVAEIVGPVPVDTPSPTLAVEKSPKKSSGFGTIMLRPTLSFSAIDSTDNSNQAHTKLFSNLNSGARFWLIQNWSESFETITMIEFERTDFEPPSNKTLSGAKHTLWDLGFGARIKPRRTFSIFGAIHNASQNFIHASQTNTNELVLKRVAIPRVSAEVMYDVLARTPFRVGVGAESAFHFSRTANEFTVKRGFSYGGKIYLKHDLDRFEIETTAFFRELNQGTALTHQTVQELGVGLGFAYKFGTGQTGKGLK